MDLKTKMLVESLRSQIVSSLVPPSHPHVWAHVLAASITHVNDCDGQLLSYVIVQYYITIKKHNIFIYLDFFKNIHYDFIFFAKSSVIFCDHIYIYFVHNMFLQKNIYIQVLMYNRDKSCFLVILHCVHLQNDSDLPLIFVNRGGQYSGVVYSRITYSLK